MPIAPPEHVLSGLAKLQRLSGETFAQLAEVLGGAPLKLFEADLASFVATRAPEVSADDIKPIIRALADIGGMARVTETPLNTLAPQLAQSSGLKLNEQQVDELAARIERLSTLRAISVPSKAKSVLYNYDNIACGTPKVFSDLRPVFGDSPDELNALVLVHILRIRYHHAQEVKDFFVAFDQDDVDAMILALQRAKSKARTLKMRMGQAETPLLGAEE